MFSIFFRYLRLAMAFLASWFQSRRALAIANLQLRQQVHCYQQSIKRPKLTCWDRVFWVVMKRRCARWRESLVIVKPETVCRWHRDGFRLFWRWKSLRGKVGRPKVSAEIRDLIRQISRDNVLWGAPKIQKELTKLGYGVCQATIDKYRIKHAKPPSPTWKSFLKNHANDIVACDFFTVPSVAFKQLYCFVVIHHATREILHLNVTSHPTAQWTGRQIVQAFPFDTAPTYLIRDNDSIYGKDFSRQVKSCGFEEVRTAYRSPWQNGICERVIGTLKRECTDHLIAFSEAHLQGKLAEFIRYYNEYRCHDSLDGDSPLGREVEPPDNGEVMSVPILGGMHHRYTRRAA